MTCKTGGETTFQSVYHANKNTKRQQVFVNIVYCAHPGRYELHVWYPKSFPSHSSAPSWRYPSPQYACLHSVVRGDTREWRGHIICAQQSTRSYYGPTNMDARLTNAAVSDNSVSVITLLPAGNLHNPITTVTFIVRCIFHGLERRQLEWKSLLQSFKKLEQKRKKTRMKIKKCSKSV